MISEKIKALLGLTGKRNGELADYMGTSQQNLNNKLYRDTISAEDLIKAALFTGATLAFIVSENQQIVFDAPSMIPEKIKALLRLTGKKNGELASYMGTSRQNLNNKFHRNTVSAEDLIKVALFTGATLAFIVSENQQIVFDASDLKKNRPDQGKTEENKE